MIAENEDSMDRNFFSAFAQAVARVTGNAWTFAFAFGIIIVWAVTGPMFDFSDTWQLIINTSTTIITFLMVFLIQNTQNRDTYAIQLKLDELIRATAKAHNALMDIEELDERELREIRDYYEKLACEARNDPRQYKKDNDNFPLTEETAQKLENYARKKNDKKKT